MLQETQATRDTNNKGTQILRYTAKFRLANNKTVKKKKN